MKPKAKRKIKKEIPAPYIHTENKIEIEFSLDISPSVRLALLYKINEIIESETGATLISDRLYDLKYRSQSSLVCSGSTNSFGRISG